MGKCFLMVLILGLSFNSYSQQDAFDFWIGEWDLTWTGKNNETLKGINSIERILDEKIIRENFSSLEKDVDSRFKGKSWSAFNSETGEWKQTWVDNTGSYLDFTGFIDGDSRGFKRSFMNSEGKEVFQRMVFHTISDDAFTWDWENSGDGENWNLLWRINYKRKTK